MRQSAPWHPRVVLAASIAGLLVTNVTHAQIFRSPAVPPATDRAAVRDWQHYLADIGESDSNAAGPALAELRRRMHAADGADAADLFRAFWRWHEGVARGESVRFDRQPNLQRALWSIAAARHVPVWHHPLRVLDTLDAKTQAALRKGHATALAELARFNRSGFDFESSEGTWYLRSDPRFIAAAAEGLPTGGFKDYVAFWAAEAEERAFEDAGLVITWDALRSRIARWEAFADPHLELPETAAVVEPEVRRLVAVYLCGVSNTPVFDYASGETDADLIASYRVFVREHSRSRYHRVVDSALRAHERSGFRADLRVVDALRPHLAHVDFRDWLSSLERRVRDLTSKRSPTGMNDPPDHGIIIAGGPIGKSLPTPACRPPGESGSWRTRGRGCTSDVDASSPLPVKYAEAPSNAQPARGGPLSERRHGRECSRRSPADRGPVPSMRRGGPACAVGILGLPVLRFQSRVDPLIRQRRRRGDLP